MKIKCDFCDAKIDTDNLRTTEEHIEFSIRQAVGTITRPGSMVGYFPVGKPIIACEKHKEQQEHAVKNIESRYL